ncbi:unnamed protein product [Rotaria socialis]|uniref:Uncharacterized protein n=1 Tax=Rotaria socialis TaxID=392032 RepID=A0A818D0M4_9BILA|nr:unnamed protein product [Rotaria socialis]CAF4665757.1 unnamed protein product [Rotaria socialis]
MKSTIFILLVAVTGLVFAETQQEWYKVQIETQVLPFYVQAYRILENHVVNELLAVNATSLGDTAVGQLVNRLYCAVREVYNSLQQSVMSSEQLQNHVSDRLQSSVAQESVYKRDIREKEIAISETDQAISGALAQFALAEQTVIEKEKGVASAEQAVRDAQDAVEKAEKCRGKRSWFSQITRPITRPIENAIKDVIIKPICSVINYGGIDNAKSRRQDAQNQLHSAQAQVQHYRQLVKEHLARKESLEMQLRGLQSLLANIQGVLQALQSELVITANITRELKIVNTQLQAVSTSSSVLHNTVAYLVDFELLITPLNAIYESIQQVTALDTTALISQNQIIQFKKSLGQIAALLPNMPFNLNTDFTC